MYNPLSSAECNRITHLGIFYVEQSTIRSLLDDDFDSFVVDLSSRPSSEWLVTHIILWVLSSREDFLVPILQPIVLVSPECDIINH